MIPEGWEKVDERRSSPSFRSQSHGTRTVFPEVKFYLRERVPDSREKTCPLLALQLNNIPVEGWIGLFVSDHLARKIRGKAGARSLFVQLVLP